MRNIILLIITLIALSGCSTNQNDVQINSEKQYDKIITEARELDKQGKSIEAKEMLDHIEIEPNDWGFYLGLKNKTDNVSTTPHSLVITGGDVKKDGDYMYATGSIKNNGDQTYSNVKVKVIYKDASDNVLDTDWTYAVDSVGLKPNETKNFELMTKHTKGTKNFVFQIIE